MDEESAEVAALRRGSPSPKLVVVLVVTLMLGAFCWSLLAPVCKPIPRDLLPSFQTQSSLAERAANGEPFAKINGRWCICRSALESAFHF